MTNKKTRREETKQNTVDKVKEITSLNPASSLEREAIEMAKNNWVYESVTNRILKELERGAVPWVKPWLVSLPHNAVSQQNYSGVNILLLWQASEEREYKQAAWLTYRQAQELGGNIKKGEKATKIIYAATANSKDNKQTTEKEESYFFLKTYAVFNIEQAEGLPERLYQTTKAPISKAKEKNELVEAFLNKQPAKLKFGGSRAYYNPSSDQIKLPTKASFNDYANYYATHLHELAHWTGHKNRLNRDLSGKFGSKNYAQEELVAEMTAAFLAAELGIKAELRHAGYIQSWITLLKEDSRALVKAASQASKAASYLKDLAE